MNRELPDVQAGFRKGRGTRDQITKSVGSQKNQENSRKTSTSASLTMLKPWLCGSQQTVKNSSRDENTIPPFPPTPQVPLTDMSWYTLLQVDSWPSFVSKNVHPSGTSNLHPRGSWEEVYASSRRSFGQLGRGGIAWSLALQNWVEGTVMTPPPLGKVTGRGTVCGASDEDSLVWDDI